MLSCRTAGLAMRSISRFSEWDEIETHWVIEKCRSSARLSNSIVENGPQLKVTRILSLHCATHGWILAASMQEAAPNCRRLSYRFHVQMVSTCLCSMCSPRHCRHRYAERYLHRPILYLGAVPKRPLQSAAQGRYGRQDELFPEVRAERHRCGPSSSLVGGAVLAS